MKAISCSGTYSWLCSKVKWAAVWISRAAKITVDLFPQSGAMMKRQARTMTRSALPGRRLDMSLCSAAHTKEGTSGHCVSSSLFAFLCMYFWLNIYFFGHGAGRVVGGWPEIFRWRAVLGWLTICGSGFMLVLEVFTLDSDEILSCLAGSTASGHCVLWVFVFFLDSSVFISSTFFYLVWCLSRSLVVT